MKNMWMVRAGENAFLINDFRNKNHVSIGWNALANFSKVTNKDTIKELVQKNKDALNYTKSGQVNMAASQINKFLFDFKQGDYVISYDPQNRVYLVGEIQSDCEYDEKLGEHRHFRKVKWLGEVSRDSLSVATRNTLGAISTIFQINETAAGEIIEVLEGKEKVSKEVGDDQEIEEETLKEDMISRANELIKDKIITLNWDEMQQLVAGILRAMGYKTSISEGGPDRGKDIEASPDGLMLTEPRILVEVKHRLGQMGSKEVRSFSSVLRQQKGLYVSTGGFSKEAKYEAERCEKQMTIVDADRLVQLIIQNYDNFDVDTKLLIPLSKIYWPT